MRSIVQDAIIQYGRSIPKPQEGELYEETIFLSEKIWEVFSDERQAGKLAKVGAVYWTESHRENIKLKIKEGEHTHPLIEGYMLKAHIQVRKDYERIIRERDKVYAKVQSADTGESLSGQRGSEQVED